MKLKQLFAAASLSLCLLGPAFAQAPATKPATPATAAPVMPAKPAASKLIDINSASSADLDALPGIGKTRAAAIIAGRPYKGKDDLLARKIIPANVYDGIKDKIIARQS